MDAIAQHIARMSPGNSLLGSDPFEEAQINQWLAWCQTAYMQNNGMHTAILAIFGIYDKLDAAKFNESVKATKEMAKVLNKALAGKQWLVGNQMTLADIYVFSICASSFQTILDGGFRKAMANLNKWFDAVSSNQAIVKRFGQVKACAKALKQASPAAEKPKEAPKAAEKADDDMDDLFGDDDGDAEEAKKVAAAAKEKAKGKKKKEVIAQSLVMFEVKPLDSETNLDDLAKQILEIKQEGLYWKTQYKKEPVAFGIFKLIIGVTVEDEKVSVDDLVEKIESIEDKV